MGIIYEQTEKLIIWLGDSGGDSKLAIDTISRGCDALDKQIASPKALMEADLTPVLKEEQGIIYLKPWLAILHLLKRPWFTRTWVGKFRTHRVA